MSMPVSIVGIGSPSLTDLPLRALMTRSSDDIGVLRLLEEDGFRHYQRGDSVPQMCTRAAQLALDDAGVLASSVDAVVVSTESFWDLVPSERQKDDPAQPAVAPRDVILHCLADSAGLAHAYPYGIWLGDCANLISSLEVAQAFVALGRHRRVLVVLADRLHPQTSRCMQNGAAILSDASAAVLLSSENGPLALRQIVSHVADRSAVRMRGGSAAAMVAALGTLAKKVEEQAQLRLSDCDAIICDNLNSFYLSLVARGLGVPERSLKCPGKVEFGHAFSVDGLLSLRKMRDAGALRSGTVVAILNIGVTVMGVILVQVN